MDLKALSDEDLAAHFTAVVTEQERRQRLALAPAQIAARYIEDGGDKADILAVIEG